LLPVSPAGILRTLRLLRRARYDLCINLLTKNSASAAVVATLSGARLRIGFAGELGHLYDVAVPRPAAPLHVVAETSLLLEPLGIRPLAGEPTRPAERLHIRLPEDALKRAEEMMEKIDRDRTEPLVVVNISGSDSSKFWGIDNYVAAA